MNINIEFFNKQTINAVGAGIYEISITRNGTTESLYIGESKTVLMRCAAHLYELSKDPNYFGFNAESIDDSSITLIFRLLESVEDTAERKAKEKTYIKARNPLSQSGYSDRQKNIDEKINAVIDFISRT